MNEYDQIAEKIREADAILVGACNGFSITEGINLFACDQAFDDLFGDVKRRHGIQSILQGMAFEWPSEEEKWGFWSRLIDRHCATYRKTTLMSDLQSVIGSKEHFVITTNGECHFEMAGFERERIYEVEGTWLEMQCASRCHDGVYPSFELAKRMAAAERAGRVPSELVPHCPRCGGPMSVHMQADANFVPNQAGLRNIQEFLRQNAAKKMVILELGVGPQNQLVKAPLMRLAAQNPNITYVTFNLSDIYIPASIAQRSFGVKGPLSKTMAELRRACVRASDKPRHLACSIDTHR